MAKQIIRGGAVIIENLVKEVQKQGGTAEDVRYLITPEGKMFLAKIASRLMAHRRYLRQFPKPRENTDEQSPVGGAPEGPGFLF